MENGVNSTDFGDNARNVMYREFLIYRIRSFKKNLLILINDFKYSKLNNENLYFYLVKTLNDTPEKIFDEFIHDMNRNENDINILEKVIPNIYKNYKETSLIFLTNKQIRDICENDNYTPVMKLYSSINIFHTVALSRLNLLINLIKSSKIKLTGKTYQGYHFK